MTTDKRDLRREADAIDRKAASAPMVDRAAQAAADRWDGSYFSTNDFRAGIANEARIGHTPLVLDSRSDAVDVPAGRPTLLDGWTSADDLGSR